MACFWFLVIVLSGALVFSFLGFAELVVLGARILQFTDALRLQFVSSDLSVSASVSPIV